MGHGDGESYQEDTPEHEYTSAGTFTIVLTAFSEDGECTSQTSADVVSNWVGLHELESNEVLAYPNPTNGFVTVELRQHHFFLESI